MPRTVDGTECRSQQGMSCDIVITTLQAWQDPTNGAPGSQWEAAASACSQQGQDCWLMQLDVRSCTFRHAEGGRPTEFGVSRHQAEAAARGSSSTGPTPPSEGADASPTRTGSLKQLWQLYSEKFLFVQASSGEVPLVLTPASADEWVLSVKRGMVSAFHVHLPPSPPLHPDAAPSRRAASTIAAAAAAGSDKPLFYAVHDDVDETGVFTARYMAAAKNPNWVILWLFGCACRRLQTSWPATDTLLLM